jgi:hypothetical protein
MPPRAKPMNRKPPTEPAARRKFRKSVWICQCCGKRTDSEEQRLECHEIPSGGSRTAALEHPECMLMLCGVNLKRGLLGCHKVVQDWPTDKQLALKKWSDPERYDRLLVLKVKRVSACYVTEDEVDALVEELKRNGVGPWLKN